MEKYEVGQSGRRETDSGVAYHQAPVTASAPSTASVQDKGVLVAEGFVEGLQWQIHRFGASWKITVERGVLDVSTSEGYAALFRLIEELKKITRPVLSEAL